MDSQSIADQNSVPAGDNIASDKLTGEKVTSEKITNPFVNQDYSVDTSHDFTQIEPEQLAQYPFKTLNRILDDIKWALPYRLHVANKSILRMKPFDYANDLARVVKSKISSAEMITLNNNLEFSKNLEVLELNDDNENQMLTAIKGLVIINDQEVNHFRIQILENSNPFFKTKPNINKYEYHCIPKELVSKDDMNQFTKTDTPGVATNFIDDLYFLTTNEELTHIIRVSIYTSEFGKPDLDSLMNQSVIKDRYLLEANKEESKLNPETIPTALHCIQKLINVLKGPILLDASSPVKTIDLTTTSLASVVDIDLLTNKLSFTLDGNNLVPPNLFDYPGLRESYKRKVLELIYLGRLVKGSNEFSSIYSFSDNLSLIYRTFNEYDKHSCQTFGKFHNSNELPFFISLSCATFFQDELVIKCFENTVKSDETNKLYYVDHLKNLISFKASTSGFPHKLQNYYDNLHKKGELYGFSDYVEALKRLGIEYTDQTSDDLLNIEDEFIISIYESNVKTDFRNYSFFNTCLDTIAAIKNSQELFKYLINEVLPVNLAITELGIEEITEDEVVITAYEFKVDELVELNELNTANKALLSLAINRKSFILMSYIENKLPDFLGTYNTNLPLDKFYEMLEINPTANEFEVINAFQNKLMSTDIRVLRQALRSYNTHKSSKLITHFLSSGKISSALLPAENWPAGLDNIGNTCYLNSLLQYYFSIKPIRDMVLEFEENDIEVMAGQQRKIGGRSIEIDETKRANQFIYHLQELFFEMIHSSKRCVAPSKDLAYLSFLPASQPVNFTASKAIDLEPFSSGQEGDPIVIDSDNNDSEKLSVKDSDSVNEIPNPFEKENESSVSTPDEMDVRSEREMDEKSEKDEERDEEQGEKDMEIQNPEEERKNKILPINAEEMESTIELGRQQDVTECIENVNFQIETALKPESIEEDGEQIDLIKKLFYGKTKQTIIPVDKPGKPRDSIERFSSLIVNVSDHPKDIYDALDNYFNADLVNLEEGLVKKTLTITKLPEILQFQVQRVLFDRERLMAYKSIEPIPFTDKLYVDRYLDTEDKDILDKREEVFNWKSDIKRLEEEKAQILSTNQETNLTIVDSLVTTKRYLEQIQIEEKYGINQETIAYIDEQITQLKASIVTIDETIEKLNTNITNQFIDYKSVGYSIFAIFIHRGEASYGHYWVYIRDPHNRHVFRKYNDEIVTEVPDLEVFNFVKGNTATPYYIAYVRDNLEEDYIEPLKRIIKC